MTIPSTTKFRVHQTATEPLPLLGRAPLQGWARLRPGQLHARRRRLGRHDQVRRQDPAGGQDGRARRRPPRHRGLHLVQGARGGEGGARCATPASTCASTATPSTRSSTRTPTTPSGSRTTSWRPSSDGDDWDLTARTTGEALKTLTARDLMRQIADAAWRCADPGVQYDTTINRWHTCPESGRINASNPCSEYMHVDDSACNLASINLMKFRNEDGSFDVEDFCHVVDVVFLRPGDRGGPLELPDRGDRPQRARLPPDRPRLREPRRAPDVERASVRLRGGAGDGGRDHGADDRARVSRVGRDRRLDRHLRRVSEEPRATQRRDADASRRRPRNRRLAGRGRPAGRRAPGLGRGRGARRGARLPQRPGHRARPHRHDQLPDGLRHHRDRARLLAGQVQGAGRRRPDEDRQPVRAAGAANARLLGQPGRADRGVRQREGDDHRRAGAGRRAPGGVRRRRRRAGDLTHGPHRDDVRGPAVHLRGDLEDRQPPRVGERRRHRGRLHAGLERSA